MKKRRLRHIAVFALAGLSGGLLLQTSQDVQRAEEEMAAIRLGVESEQESMRVLHAEWDYLNNPERLEALAARYLDLVPPTDATVVSTPASLPEAVSPVIPPQKPSLAISPVSYTPSASVAPEVPE